jgi:hypothetical protein
MTAHTSASCVHCDITSGDAWECNHPNANEKLVALGFERGEYPPICAWGSATTPPPEWCPGYEPHEEWPR